MTLAKLPHFSVTWISWEHCHYEHLGNYSTRLKLLNKTRGRAALSGLWCNAGRDTQAKVFKLVSH